jgi:hypothetical protein
MKKSKFDYDMEKFEGNKTKMDSLTSVQTNWDSGKYNSTIDGVEKLDTFKLGLAYLEAKNGIDWVAKKKKQLVDDGVTTDWVDFVNQEGSRPNLKNDLANIDFKSRSTIESNYMTAIQSIEDKYATMLKKASGDSPLTKLILGKKKEEIDNLNIDIEQDKKDVKIIDESNKYIVKKTDSNLEKVLDTDEVTMTDAVETVDTEIVDTGELELGTTKKANKISNTFKKKAITKLEEMKEYKYSDKESKDTFSSFVLRTVPASDAKKYFNEAEKDGTLSAKIGIINAEKTFQSILKNSAKDLDINQLAVLTDGKTGIITNYTGFNARTSLAERHIEQYGNWYSDGEVLGKDGSWGNLLTKETNILTLPPQSVIDMNNNSLKGFNIIIPNGSQVISADSINNYTNGNTDKNINMDVKTYIGQVYLKVLEDEAIKLQKRDDIENKELAMNILQTKMQNDTGGNDAFTKKVRTTIANSLGVFEETDKTTIKATVDTVAPEKVANENEINKTRKIKVTHPNLNDGKETEIALTEKNKKILDNYGIDYSYKEDKTIGDASVAEQIEANKVKKKIKPADIGVKNMPVFESLKSVQDILPNAMTGREIKEKYEINFFLNDKTTYQPSKFITEQYR